ncbi:L-glutamate gamma-semialdehyde dehydrogenase [Ralstonia syzygii]|uniref:L-glutamate gamma-semialdehyde dehydrogenase n=1 Tax=Ralstonia syzygii R24 TaxID=907261 RepID=G3A5N7_9RALS|nr:L-glutamate gamma-semialdehyde dehydrogenase [Ralstonia syzygii]CCA88786.1 putative delta-1-pyrroline-5-carboxylate dehydrogenase [Ralstonia syzygii R24]
MSSLASTYTTVNEPVFSYVPGSPERLALEAELARQSQVVVDIPLVVGGERLQGEGTLEVTCPHNHKHVLARVSQANSSAVGRAIEAAENARPAWAAMSFEDRAAIFLRAADLLAGPWRQKVNAATMLGQSKTAYQAEIDSACELIDFLRFNVAFAAKLREEQPVSSSGNRNTLDYRPLEGFVYAVSPFNFTAIGGNLATAPALMGNTVIWKPAATAALSNFLFMELLEAAGLPAGVINFLPGEPQTISDALLASPGLAGIHFTGSTAVFDQLWLQTAKNLSAYRGYPRLVGETGGKDFVVAHPSADVEALTTALIRGAFEYQGQKCSAASRAYIPASLWPEVKCRLIEQLETVRMGDVADFRNFMGAVIDQRAYTRITNAIADGLKRSGNELVFGGDYSNDVGYFVQPTVIQVGAPDDRLMCDEIFGPVLAVHVYDDIKWTETLALVNSTSQYGLTGAVFATDRAAILAASEQLRFAAGNFYINDKPTGAVVGQQPFGGGRRSGTNDKAGSHLNLLRWISPRTVKETYVSPTQYKYPFMAN